MYEKDLNHQIVIRINDKDMEFLRILSQYRDVSMSKVIRSIISDYRRATDYISSSDILEDLDYDQ